MSIEPEDSLEAALRGDLPSPDTETRLRGRLLAAGIAIGNGVATTTAAAGTAASGTAASGLVAKVVGLSWGVKLGVAAMVAIPTVGLLLEGRAERQKLAESSGPASVRAAETQAARTRALATAPLPRVAAEVGVEIRKPDAEQPTAAKSVRSGVAPDPVPAAIADGADGATHPSRADFGAVDAPVRAPQVASTLAEETRLLDGAFAALAAGDRSRARQLIEEHAARYPSGLLQKERERARLRLSEMSRGE